MHTDHLGRKVAIPDPPSRIISLCPSQTATLFALGLEGRIVGRTHFCIHPKPQVDGAVAVGGTKQVKYDRIEALQPDLVIAEKEENTREMVETLAARYPVYVTDVRDIPSALQMVRDLGTITGTSSQAEALASEIQTAFHNLEPWHPHAGVLYFIWRKPWMLAGADTYIDAVLSACGLANLAQHLKGRYPEANLESLKPFSPQYIFLSSEPFPFAEKHVSEIQKVFPHSKVALVDGEMFSWYGSRMVDAPRYLNKLRKEL